MFINKLSKIFYNPYEVIKSPILGEVVPLKDIKDGVFSSEILGKGIAIKPFEGKLYSPSDGVVSSFFHTKHAIAILTNTGVEILIHIGIDTVKLNGNYFTSFINEKDKIKEGQLLLEFDIDNIINEGYSIVTPIIITNSDNYSNVDITTKNKISVGEELIKLYKKKK